jgi:hypothetical protein
MTFTGRGLFTNPETEPPADHTIASTMLESEPTPQAPNARTDNTFEDGATPEIPMLLFVTAARIPAT